MYGHIDTLRYLPRLYRVRYTISTMKNVSIYTTATCTYCKQAKELFKEHNIAYNEYDVGTDAVRRKEMIDLTAQMGVPVIRVDDQVMVGYNKDMLSKALGI